MSKHWKPGQQLDCVDSRRADRWESRAAEGVTPWSLEDSFAAPPAPRRKTEMSGAVVGLALLTVACVGICAGLYQLMGPRSSFAEPND